MDVKVNSHKSWLGLSTLEALNDVARLGGCGLWSLPNVHKVYSMCPLELSSLPGTAFRSQPLRWHLSQSAASSCSGKGLWG